MNGGNVDGQLHVELVAPADASHDQRATNEVLDALVGAGIPVLGFEIEGGRLQDAFLQLTEGERG
jgi:ABC-2 type transport system ATP-binding protein